MKLNPDSDSSSNKRTWTQLVQAFTALVLSLIAALSAIEEFLHKVGSLRVGAALVAAGGFAVLGMWAWNRPTLREQLKHWWQIPVSIFAIIAAVVAIFGGPHWGGSQDKPTATPAMSQSPLPVPPTASAALPATAPIPSSAPTTQVPGAASCLDGFFVPAGKSLTPAMSLTVTCPVTSGSSLFLISEIDSANGQGGTEYYLIKDWPIQNDDADVQAYKSNPVKPGTTRLYYIVSATSAQYSQIETSANESANNGSVSLFGATIVSVGYVYTT